MPNPWNRKTTDCFLRHKMSRTANVVIAGGPEFLQFSGGPLTSISKLPKYSYLDTWTIAQKSSKSESGSYKRYDRDLKKRHH